MDRFGVTLDELQKFREKSDAVIVGYSGGKDSKVVMDLCVRTFSRVEAFFMYLIPDLECVDEMLAEAKVRWGVTVRQYPHWCLSKYLLQGLYCFNSYKLDDMPELKLFDIYGSVMRDTGISVIATGAKKTDSIWRKRQLAQWGKELLSPLREWNKHDVLAYLKLRGMPLPELTTKRNTSGIDLTYYDLAALKEHWPRDYEKLLVVFPLAEACIKRFEFYGLTN